MAVAVASVATATPRPGLDAHLLDEARVERAMNVAVPV